MAIENDPELKKLYGSDIKMDLMKNWRDQLLAQVRGERNHPSVMLWSIENEWLCIFRGSGAGGRHPASRALRQGPFQWVRLPAYAAPDLAVNAMGALREYDRLKKMLKEQTLACVSTDPTEARAVIAKARSEGRNALTGFEVFKLGLEPDRPVLLRRRSCRRARRYARTLGDISIYTHPRSPGPRRSPTAQTETEIL